jgi:hypothetical protein
MILGGAPPDDERPPPQDTDRDDVAALLAASYRVLAPRELAKLVTWMAARPEPAVTPALPAVPSLMRPGH